MSKCVKKGLLVILGFILGLTPLLLTLNSFSSSEASEVYHFVTKWSNLNKPKSISTFSNTIVYVADTDNNQIQVFKSDGTFVTTWGSLGSGNGQFNHPQGIAVDSNGSVYVADTNNHRVQKFSPDGLLITKWGSQGSGDGQFEGPTGIATDSSGNVYVADTYNHRVQKFSSGGTFITKWGTLGSVDGKFSCPRGVTVDKSGNVYVADTVFSNYVSVVNNRIQKFSSDGRFLAKFGTSGTGDSQFNNPCGVAADGSGLFVADTNNHRVQKFSPDGLLIAKWGSQGSGDGQFSSPAGIAVDSVGNVYVADTDNSRVQKFSYDITPPKIYLSSPPEKPSPYKIASQKAQVIGWTDDVGASLTLNGQPVKLTVSGNVANFQFEYKLSLGTNTLIFVAKDAIGNTTTVTRTVVFNPAVKISDYTVSELITPTQSASITFPDGSLKLDIPAGALPKSARFKIAPKLVPATANNKELKTLGSIFDLTVTAVDGSRITTLKKPVLIKFAYSQSVINSRKINESKLWIFNYTSTSKYRNTKDKGIASGRWVPVINVTVNKKQNFALCRIRHFSAYALMADMKAPDIALKGFKDNSTIVRKGITTINPTVRDMGMGIKHVQFFLDNKLKATDTKAPYTWNLDEQDGSHVLKIIAKDWFNNSSKISRRLKLKDQIPPVIKNLRAEPSSFDPHKGESTKITYTLYEPVRTRMKTKVRIFLRFDSVDLTIRTNQLADSNGETNTIVWRGYIWTSQGYKIVPPGKYSFTLVAKDPAGNKAIVSSRVTVK